MGLPISVALRGRHAGSPAGLAAWDRVLARLRDVDRVFSTYRPDSWVSRLGRGEVDVVDCPPEVAVVLELGERARAQSGGAFSVWRPGADGHVALDADGVVKGWAVQRAAAELTALPETDACLSGGGDLVCWTADPHGVPWQVGVEHPLDPRRLVARIPVTRGAVATSGAAHRGAHVVDARTGLAAAGVASVTVVADDLTWADIDATAAFAMGDGALPWLRGRARRSGVVVLPDGRAEVFDTRA